jgi:hypothetical protein
MFEKYLSIGEADNLHSSEIKERYFFAICRTGYIIGDAWCNIHFLMSDIYKVVWSLIFVAYSTSQSEGATAQDYFIRMAVGIFIVGILLAWCILRSLPTMRFYAQALDAEAKTILPFGAALRIGAKFR